MTAEYRELRAGDENATLDLWAEVFRCDRGYFERYFAGDAARRPEHTLVAAARDDGRILAAVHYCLRALRDENGDPLTVGCIANVATREDARRAGHSGRLLERAITAMAADGCAWSLLFTGRHAHYERYGWRTIPTDYRQGTVRGGGAVGGPAAAQAPGFVVQPLSLDRPDAWTSLATVYEEFNARRPLSVVRSADYWRGFGARLFVAPEALILTAAPAEGGIMSGYLLLHFTESAIDIKEVAVRRGEDAPAVARALLTAAAQEAASRNRAQAYLPTIPIFAEVFDAVFAPSEGVQRRSTMVRAIAPGFPESRIDAMYAPAAPESHFWEADYF